MTEDRPLVTSYVMRHTEPVQWVTWWCDVSDPVTKDRLRSILFGTNSQGLEDLTHEAIRQQVLDVVLSNETLQQMVLDEANQLVDAIANTLCKEGPSPS